jgi:hypothetical protein
VGSNTIAFYGYLRKAVKPKNRADMCTDWTKTRLWRVQGLDQAKIAWLWRRRSLERSWTACFLRGTLQRGDKVGIRAWDALTLARTYNHDLDVCGRGFELRNIKARHSFPTFAFRLSTGRDAQLDAHTSTADFTETRHAVPAIRVRSYRSPRPTVKLRHQVCLRYRVPTMCFWTRENGGTQSGSLV